MDVNIRSTTILGVRKKGIVALGGDGQVTFGDMAFKQKAVKVRKFESEKGVILGGFAGAAADALTLFEKFESKLDEYEGDLTRAVVELAKEWRMDKYLRTRFAFCRFKITQQGIESNPSGVIGSFCCYSKTALQLQEGKLKCPPSVGV